MPPIVTRHATDTVDELIGSAYPIVKLVARNIAHVKRVSEHYLEVDGVFANIPYIYGVYNNIETIASLAVSIDGIIDITNHFDEIMEIYNNLPAILSASGDATAAVLLAQSWAMNDFNDDVEPGMYSAKHWSIASQNSADTASSAATTANGSAVAAASSSTTANVAKLAAEAARDAAVIAETAAELAETNAETAQGLSEAARDAALVAQTAAELAETHAETAETNAEAAQVAAEAARDAAQSSEDDAEAAQVAAAASASAASGSASTASTQAGIATTQAGIATTQAGTATTQAGIATTKAADAETARAAAVVAKVAAELAETNAETAETNAELAETNAEAAQAAAEAAATAASGSAVAADASADAAALSAIAAATAETNAELAETNAETAETNAAASAVAADASADAAAISAAAALTSENNAETAETNAETAETNAVAAKVAAEAARDAALAAQTAAELAETHAETAETNAETAETNAEAAQAAAEAALDTFTDIYLGAKASDPTLDNDGNALQDGAFYWHTSLNSLRFYDLGTTSWSTFASGGGGTVLAADVTYDNTGSGLTAVDAQDAIDELDTRLDGVKTKTDFITVTQAVDLDAIETNSNASKTKTDYITITQAVDLDAIETRVNALDAAVVLKGTWNASGGTFPGGGTAQAGDSYIVSVGGTVDSQIFVANDRIIAIFDNASTTTFAANWFKADYTDQVLSVAGKTGALTLQVADITDMTANGRSLVSAADYAAMKALLDLEIGTDVQAYDADLSEIAALANVSGDILYTDNTPAWARLAKGTDGQVLTLASGLPSWADASGGVGKPYIAFFPTDSEPTSSNYAYVGIRNNHPYLAFDTTTQWTTHFSGVLPNGYAGGGLTCTVYVGLASATTGTVGFDAAIERIDASSLDLDADSFTTAKTITATTVPGTAGQILALSVTFSDGAEMDSLAAGEAFRLRIRRDVANDTAAGNAEVYAVILREP